MPRGCQPSLPVSVEQWPRARQAALGWDEGGAGEGRSSPRKAAVSRCKNFLALRDAPDKQLPDAGVGSQALGRQQRLVMN